MDVCLVMWADPFTYLGNYSCLIVTLIVSLVAPKYSEMVLFLLIVVSESALSRFGVIVLLSGVVTCQGPRTEGQHQLFRKT